MMIPYQFDPATVDLILEGLGKLPHDRVRTTIDGIREHAMKTVDDARKAQDEQQRAQWVAERKPSRKKSA
jgi:hypothetical protein